MDPLVVLAVLAILIITLLILGAPLKPLRYLGQGLIKLVIGALLLFFFNVFGAMFNYYIPINIITTAVSGFLGIPGIILLVIIKKFII